MLSALQRADHARGGARGMPIYALLLSGGATQSKQASSTPVPRIGTLILPHSKVVRDIDREIELREGPGKVKAMFAFTQWRKHQV